ncbi:MAG: transcription antitermination factor NusB, partial [bacterium]|nr:transcription antitermination factor NusB [bacterium]
MSLGSPSKIRALAWTILGQCLSQDHFASELIDRALHQHSLSTEDRGLLTQIVYGTLREWGFLSNIIHERLRSKTANKFIHLMGISAYQLLFLRKVPDHAVLNEAVSLAKAKGGEGMGRLVNAVMRNIQEERGKILEEWERPEGKAATFPKWLWQRWVKRWGEVKALELAHSFNAVPRTFARVNLREMSREELVKNLAHEWVKVEMLGEGPMVGLPPRARAKALPLIEQGKLSLQDYNSYQIVHRLGPQAGEKGVDVCAGHGGKTAAILELDQGKMEVWAH